MRTKYATRAALCADSSDADDQQPPSCQQPMPTVVTAKPVLPSTHCSSPILLMVDRARLSSVMVMAPLATGNVATVTARHSAPLSA